MCLQTTPTLSAFAVGDVVTLQPSGLVAQGIERLRPKEGVGGSSPSEAAS